MDGIEQDYLNRIMKSSDHMRQLLNDLLQFSKIATRTQPYKMVNLMKIVQKAADGFKEDIKESGAIVEIDGLPKIEADETQVLRLFQNIFANALKFKGYKKPRITVCAKLDGLGNCEILVKDNGIGFNQKYAELIFKPFQRLHRRGEYEGTGMGLAICRKIVERQGGTIRAESESGKGATFIVRLPVAHSHRDI